MTDQSRINDQGLLSWDGEPMFAPATVRETGAGELQRLFSVGAFEQMQGQAAMDTDGEEKR